MQHSFDVEIAEKYGIVPAIILNHLQFWILKNKANNVNFYDGYYWTYNSIKAFKELFPYVSEKQIITALSKLENEGLIITGNYNKIAYDRTKWYALTEKGFSILQNRETHLPEMSNGNDTEGKPIPYINTDINSDINTDIKKVSKKESKKESYEEILDTIQDQGLKELYLEYIKMRKMIKAPMTNRALTTLINKVNSLEPCNVENQKQLLDKAILNNWKSVYPLKEDEKKTESKEPKRYGGTYL